MPTERLPDEPEDQRKYSMPIGCAHPEHNPPSMMVFEPGRYRHTCPSCGRAIVFTVQRPYWSAAPSGTVNWVEETQQQSGGSDGNVV